MGGIQDQCSFSRDYRQLPEGQYDVHETATEWRVHLDNHDPKYHPLLHLIDDAPLLLMIGDTFVTLVSGTRNKTGNEQMILEGQVRA